MTKVFKIAFILLVTFSLPLTAIADSNFVNSPTVSDYPDDSYGGVDATDPGVAANSGTQVAASLETAGYLAQSIVLDDLASVIEGLGVLIYIAVAIGGLLSLVIFGEFRLGICLILCPALFHFVIGARTHATGAEWQMGSVHYKKGTINQEIKDKVDANVSWVFHRYNRLISSIISETITALSDDHLKKQMKFLARQRVMDDLFTMDVREPGLNALIELNFRECNTYMEASRLVALGLRDPYYKKTAEYVKAEATVDQYQTGGGNKIKLNGPARNYVDDLLTSIAGLSSAERDELINSSGMTCLTNPEVGGSLRNIKGQMNSATCERLWCWMGAGLKSQVSKDMHHFARRHTNPDIPYSFLEEILKDVETKMTFECIEDPDQVANEHVKEGCHRKDDGTAEDHAVTAENSLSMIPVIISGHILRKKMSSGMHARSMTEFSKHAGISNQMINFSYNLNEEKRQRISRSQLQHQQAQAKQSEVFTWAMTLPYIQGTILYTLSVTFPFFALFILVPGYSGAFITWMMLWLWVKSWDLGWAFMMIIDDVLWSLMPHNSYYDSIRDPMHGPITIFESAFHGDPSYNLMTYYTLLSVLMTGVPVITAQLIMGAKGAISSLLFEGIGDMGEQMGGASADWAAIGQLYRNSYLRDSAQINTTRNLMKNSLKTGASATRELTKFDQEIDGKKESGKKTSFWGKVAAGVGAAIVIGVVVVATGGIALGVGAGVALAGIGLTTKTAVAATVATGAVIYAGGSGAIEQGVVMQQRANTAKAQIIDANSVYYRHQMSQTQSSFFLENLRAAQSNRPEFWNFADAPKNALRRVEQQVMNLRKDKAEMWSSVATKPFRDTYETIKMFRGIR